MSGKISLRPVERADLAFLTALANDPEVRANVVGWDLPLSLAGQDAWFDGIIGSKTTMRFMVMLDEVTPIGMTGLWSIDWRNRTAETALKLGVAPEARGRGFGTTAIRLVEEFAFEDAGLRKLTSSIIEGNHASFAAYVRKSGWSVEGRLVEQVWRWGGYQDLLLIGKFNPSARTERHHDSR